MLSQLRFWTIVVGIVAYVIKYFVPSFPFDETQILALVVFLLGLFGITPQVRSKAASFGGLLRSKAFWTLVAGALAYIAHFYFPEFPVDEAAFLAIIFFVLNQFGITPEMAKFVAKG